MTYQPEFDRTNEHLFGRFDKIDVAFHDGSLSIDLSQVDADGEMHLVETHFYKDAADDMLVEFIRGMESIVRHNRQTMTVDYPDTEWSLMRWLSRNGKKMLMLRGIA